MLIIGDYNDLDVLEKFEGREVLVLYSNHIHRVIDGKWVLVGRLDQDGKITYRIDGEDVFRVGY